MLVLTRKIGETIAIDDHIKITVVQIKGKQVRLGIEAPKETKIHREEIYQAIQEQNKAAIQSSASAVTKMKPVVTERAPDKGPDHSPHKVAEKKTGTNG